MLRNNKRYADRMKQTPAEEDIRWQKMIYAGRRRYTPAEGNIRGQKKTYAGRR